jgi:hypothetical protein
MPWEFCQGKLNTLKYKEILARDGIRGGRFKAHIRATSGASERRYEASGSGLTTLFHNTESSGSVSRRRTAYS